MGHNYKQAHRRAIYDTDTQGRKRASALTRQGARRLPRNIYALPSRAARSSRLPRRSTGTAAPRPKLADISFEIVGGSYHTEGRFLDDGPGDPRIGAVSHIHRLVLLAVRHYQHRPLALEHVDDAYHLLHKRCTSQHVSGKGAEDDCELT